METYHSTHQTLLLLEMEKDFWCAEGRDFINPIVADKALMMCKNEEQTASLCKFDCWVKVWIFYLTFEWWKTQERGFFKVTWTVD